MKIAVVDTGIFLNHPLFLDKKINGYSIKKKNGKIVVDNNIEDEQGHGTAVASILFKETDNVEIIPIKIFFDGDFVTEPDLMIAALNHIKTIECNIVLLSLGITGLLPDEIKKIKNLCDEINNKGILIVSAFDNYGALSYPACLPNVIGVDGDEDLIHINDYYVADDDGIIDVYGRSGIQRVAWIKPLYRLVIGTSFAAAHVVAQICKLAEHHFFMSKDKVMQILKENAKKVYTAKQEYNTFAKFGDIKKAAIYPYNKEMHSLIRYENLLNFSIEKVYDERKRGLIGKSAQSIIIADCETGLSFYSQKEQKQSYSGNV